MRPFITVWDVVMAHAAGVILGIVVVLVLAWILDRVLGKGYDA